MELNLKALSARTAPSFGLPSLEFWGLVPLSDTSRFVCVVCCGPWQRRHKWHTVISGQFPLRSCRCDCFSCGFHVPNMASVHPTRVMTTIMTGTGDSGDGDAGSCVIGGMLKLVGGWGGCGCVRGGCGRAGQLQSQYNDGGDDDCAPSSEVVLVRKGFIRCTFRSRQHRNQHSAMPMPLLQAQSTEATMPQSSNTLNGPKLQSLQTTMPISEPRNPPQP